MTCVPYTFKFDETTTVQTKNQYDGSLQYWSSSCEEIVNSYYDSIIIGHCSHKVFIQHYHEFENAIELDLTHILHLVMYDPNVNKNFASVLVSEIEEEANSKVLNIGTCSLHPVHTSFRKRLKNLILILMSYFMTSLYFQVIKCLP